MTQVDPMNQIDEEQRDIEIFNQHQADVRHRFNFLVQSICLLAGGALTASIAIFTGSRSVSLSGMQASVLTCSWWSLVASICLSVIAVAAVLLRDYFFGERWRRQLLGDTSVNLEGTPGASDIVIVSSGLLSVITFLGGFMGLAYVATNVVGR